MVIGEHNFVAYFVADALPTRLAMHWCSRYSHSHERVILRRRRGTCGFQEASP
jgi:hypothetical protein